MRLFQKMSSKSVRKMALVPYDTMNNLNSLSSINLQKQENKDPNLLAMSRLDHEMMEILNNSSLSTEKKLALYQQLFHPYGTIDQQNDLEQIEQKKRQDNQTSANTNKSLQNVLKYIPKAKQNKVKILIDHLEANPLFDWSDKRELIIGGETVKNSNLIDLISDVIKDKGTTVQGPPGMAQFMAALVKSNIPKIAILNSKRRDLLVSPQKSPEHERSPFGLEESVDDRDPDDVFTTPISNRFSPLTPLVQKRRSRRRRPKLLQQQKGFGKWTSYYK